jgi:SAM-dependent methyltransferase
VTDVSYLLKDAHAEAAAVHASARVGLIDDIVAAPGRHLGTLAERCGITPYAARVLTQVLRIGGGVRRDDAGGLHPGPGLDRGLAGQLRTESARAAEQWADLGDLAAGLRAGANSAIGAIGDLPGPPSAERGGAWLLDRARWGHLRTRILGAAAELGILTVLADDPLRAETVAERAGVPRDAAAGVLDALLRMGFSTHSGEWHALGDRLAGVLRHPRGGDALLLGAQLAHEFWPALGHLTHTARTGELTLDLQDDAVASRYYLRLARYNSLLFPSYLGMASAVATALASSAPATGRVVDVGAGSGVWGIAFGRAWPRSSVLFLDRPRVLAQSQANVRRVGIGERSRFAAADLATDPLGTTGDADAVILGQICHTQPVATLPDLLERCAAALRPGGVLVLADMVLDRTGNGPVPYLHFAVKELVATAGAILDLDEYRDLLTKAGFIRAPLYRFPGLDVLLATRDGAALPSTVDGCLEVVP